MPYFKLSFSFVSDSGSFTIGWFIGGLAGLHWRLNLE